LNYSELEDKFGKRNMAKCSALYRKYILEQMGTTTKNVIAGVEKYLSRISPILGGGVNTKELLEELVEWRFWDQVVILTHYYDRMKRNNLPIT
jgi:hypothetical protein